MFSKRFATWIGVGALGVATIPTFAAPHLARLISRKPAAKAVAAKPAAKKPTTKPAPKPQATTRPAEPKLHAAPVAHAVRGNAMAQKFAGKKKTGAKPASIRIVAHKTADAPSKTVH